jgi:hypothetical protein
MSEDTITRSRAVAILSEIARNERNDVADRIYAIEVLARILGWNQPAPQALGNGGIESQ